MVFTRYPSDLLSFIYTINHRLILMSTNALPTILLCLDAEVIVMITITNDCYKYTLKAGKAKANRLGSASASCQQLLMQIDTAHKSNYRQTVIYLFFKFCTSSTFGVC